MTSKLTKHHRRSMRRKKYDYSRTGAYFVTICTEGQESLFGTIIDKEMVLNSAGQMICDTWEKLPTRFPNMMMDEFMVMPDHFHGLVFYTTQVNFVGANLVFALIPATLMQANTRFAPTEHRQILWAVLSRRINLSLPANTLPV